MTSHFDISSDPELKDRVRTLTGYEDNDDELPNEELEGIIQTVKLKLSSQYDSTSWYSNRPYSLILLGTTAIYAKAQVENYSVDSWSIGDESISVNTTSPEDSMQFQRWNELVNTGVKNSDILDSSDASTMKNTSSYIG